MTAFPNGTHILFQSVPPLEPFQLSSTFLPVDEFHDGQFSWRRFRRIKAPVHQPEGANFHLTVEFADSSEKGRSFNLSHNTDIAVVIADAGDQVTFTPGFTLLRGTLSTGDLFTFGTAVFLPVGSVEYLGHTWEKFSLTKTYHLVGDSLTVDFQNPAIEPRPYPLSEPLTLFPPRGRPVR